MKFSDSGNGTFEQPPVGTHVARCIKVQDLGTQKGEYQGQVTFKRQVIIAWELPNEVMTKGDYAGKPFTVSKFYTASLNEKATLRHHLEAWRGRQFTPEELGGFDSKNLLGKPCMLSIIANEKGNSKVGAVMALPKGTAVPEQVNPTVHFSLDAFDAEVFASFSEKMQNIIRLSPEFQALQQKGTQAKAGAFDDMTDDIPF